MHLLDLLSPGRVVVPGSVPGKKRLLERAAALLAGGNPEVERAVFDALVGRERMGSTGLGHGVAIPHGRSAQVATASGCFMRLPEPVDFGSPDGKPVDLVFAMVVPEHFTSQHLVLLSQLAEMFGEESFRGRLRAASDAAALYALLSGWQPATLEA